MYPMKFFLSIDHSRTVHSVQSSGTLFMVPLIDQERDKKCIAVLNVESE